jgi:hypothetical protein
MPATLGVIAALEITRRWNTRVESLERKRRVPAASAGQG